MQMVVVFVFVVCNCLAMVSNILELFQVDAVYVLMISNFLVTLNSSVNLFIYCAFGERFRNEIKRILNQMKRRTQKCCCHMQDEHFLINNADMATRSAVSVQAITRTESNKIPSGVTIQTFSDV